MNYFHHSSVKNYTIALLDLFNDIHLPRYSEDGERLQDIVLPISFGSREKAYQLNDVDIENLLNGNVNILPRMALEFNSLSKAMERNTNKNHKINKRSANTSEILETEYQYNSVSYDFDFTLHIATRTFTDATIIIEQIAPMFRPDYSIKIQELDIQEEPTTIPVAIGDFDITIPEVDETEIRIIEVSLPLVIKGNLYLPIKEDKIINDLNINIIDTDIKRNIKSIDYEIDPITSTIVENLEGEDKIDRFSEESEND